MDLEKQLHDKLEALKPDWQESIEYTYRSREPYVTELVFHLEKIKDARICYRIVSYLRHAMPMKGQTLFIPKNESSIGAQICKESNKLTATELNYAAYLGAVIKQQELKMILAYGIDE